MQLLLVLALMPGLNFLQLLVLTALHIRIRVLPLVERVVHLHRIQLQWELGPVLNSMQ